jgi:hypothetical protein
MAVIINRNTTQSPLAAAGNTGSQVIRFIPGSRVYVKSPDSTTTAPVQNYFTKSNGATPTGWTDLGTMSGPGTVVYTKNKVKVQTGIDKVVRATYIGEKLANIQADLDQFDDTVLAQMTGLSPSIITAGSVVNFQVGQEDVVSKALLLVCQNKLDGKEIQFYHPAAQMAFTIKYTGDQMLLSLDAELIAFNTANGAATDSLMSVSVFA